MKLYYTPGACSLAPRIAAYEAGLELEYDKVNLKTQTTASGRDYLRINPKASVPALALGNGEVLTEAAVILQYLADRAPGAGLLPEPGTLERYRVQEWLSFIGAELHKGFCPLWSATAPDAARRLAIEHLHRSFAYLDSVLRGRVYLLDDRFTVADAYCFPILNWSHFYRIELSGYRDMLAYMARVATRPRVRRALQDEGLPIAA